MAGKDAGDRLWLRPRRAVAFAGIAAITAGLAVTQPASALSGREGTYKNGVAIRSGPSTAYPALGLGYTGQTACLYYYVTGQSINGNNRWWYNGDFSTGVTGYTTETLLYVYNAYIGCASI